MRKYLLWINEKLYAFLFIVSVFYMGIDFGRSAQIYAELYGAEWVPELKFYILFFITAYALFWVISRSQYTNHIHISVKSCLCMAALTLVSILQYWIVALIADLRFTVVGSYEPHRWYYILKVIVYPAVLFGVSLIICINYIICAVQIRKENKALKQNG